MLNCYLIKIRRDSNTFQRSSKFNKYKYTIDVHQSTKKKKKDRKKENEIHIENWQCSAKARQVSNWIGSFDRLANRAIPRSHSLSTQNCCLRRCLSRYSIFFEVEGLSSRRKQHYHDERDDTLRDLKFELVKTDRA